MIDYPNKLNIIFDKLELFNIKPIIIGGYVRDKLLKLDSKDIDIEVYGIDSLIELEDILKEFGSINSVGKSFGVCKLRFEELDLDFSLPRTDSKIDSGHTGFKIKTDKNLNFKAATSRRDFTINAIGFDILNKTLLDPFKGLEDLESKILRAVDIEKFDEDPLRVLRAIQFSARFDLRLNQELFEKCRSMVKLGVLRELPSERIFEEFKKLLLKSEKPSKGFALLRELDTFSFFNEFQTITNEEFQNIICGLDLLASYGVKNEKNALMLMLALICSQFSVKNIDSFLDKLTKENKLHKNVNLFINCFKNTKINSLSNFDIYLLASKIELKSFLLFLRAKNLGKKDKEIDVLKIKAKELGVYMEPIPALIQGKDLVNFGLKPSKEFSTILDKVYDAQIKELFETKEEALKWLKNYLLS